jgi:hypothetical protein
VRGRVYLRAQRLPLFKGTLSLILLLAKFCFFIRYLLFCPSLIRCFFFPLSSDSRLTLCRLRLSSGGFGTNSLAFHAHILSCSHVAALDAILIRYSCPSITCMILLRTLSTPLLIGCLPAWLRIFCTITVFMFSLVLSNIHAQIASLCLTLSLLMFITTGLHFFYLCCSNFHNADCPLERSISVKGLLVTTKQLPICQHFALPII